MPPPTRPRPAQTIPRRSAPCPRYSTVAGDQRHCESRRALEARKRQLYGRPYMRTDAINWFASSELCRSLQDGGKTPLTDQARADRLRLRMPASGCCTSGELQRTFASVVRHKTNRLVAVRLPWRRCRLQSLASFSTIRNGGGPFTPTSPRKCRRSVKLSQPWGQRNAYEPQKGIEVDALGALSAGPISASTW